MVVVMVRMGDSWLVIYLDRRRLRWRIMEVSVYRGLVELVEVSRRLLVSDKGIGDRSTALADAIQQRNGVPHQHRPDYVLLKCLQVLPFNLVVQGIVHCLKPLELLIIVCLLLTYSLIVGLVCPILLSSAHIELRHMQSTYLAVAVVVIAVLVRAEEKLDFVVEAVAEVRVLVSSSFLFGEVRELLLSQPSPLILLTLLQSRTLVSAPLLSPWRLRQSVDYEGLHLAALARQVAFRRRPVSHLHLVLRYVVSLRVEAESCQARTSNGQELIVPHVPAFVMDGEDGLPVDTLDDHPDFSCAPNIVRVPDVQLLADVNLVYLLL